MIIGNSCLAGINTQIFIKNLQNSIFSITFDPIRRLESKPCPPDSFASRLPFPCPRSWFMTRGTSHDLVRSSLHSKSYRAIPMSYVVCLLYLRIDCEFCQDDNIEIRGYDSQVPCPIVTWWRLIAPWGSLRQSCLGNLWPLYSYTLYQYSV